MYSKLATRNLKRSLKDYTIYFLTLIFAVSIFYVFNSIESQRIMMELSDMQANAFELVSKTMGIASKFMAFILGFLIVYANNYLIKRRKKEFGIYMTLGMEKGSLSRVIFMETLMVGVISLIIGLTIGVLLSQGLSILTAKMFQVNLVKFKFVFSETAAIRTVLCFGIIYLVVLLFNTISIRKIKLIDLLTSSRKNETVKVKNIWVSVLVFIISLMMIGEAYYIVLSKGIAEIGFNFNLMSILLGVLGTFLFFFSLSGFLLKLVQSNKRHYLKGLNMFILRQINSKINSTFVSMTFICLMLFVAICTFSGGIGINKALNSDLKDLTKFDVTFWDLDGSDIEEVLREKGIEINDYASSYMKYTTYKNNFGFKDFLNEDEAEDAKSYYPVAKNQGVPIVKLSDFNSIMKMLNMKEVSLEKDEYLAFGDIKDLKKGVQNQINNKKKINVNGIELKPANTEFFEITPYNQMMKSNLCTFVVNDSLVDGLEKLQSYLSMNYKIDKDKCEKDFGEKVRGGYKDSEMDTYYMTKEEQLSNSAGLGAVVSYLGIYIGVVFLITSAAVLALQQLSESTENIERYKLLTKIGVDRSMINKSLFVQISIYFIVPLSLALVHSIVGLKISSHVVATFGNSSIMDNILIAVVALVIIYGGYFMATYLGAKKNISQN
ncbi:ABC transporter permease [Clostridium septicum]|uniref:ABC transporter n=1 Tax=Clostridium septicum TaxID=1504 RepID=A0A9N7JJJ1_CLOSE|nr:ABC transporter permease [Clostridium septicum]AYE33608.1 ABC transporter [Clostridium septicum]QAS61772.1 ABC transporter permease [Clostridium septicum]UEC21781.1 ABC transporter permease [Clostridium septicum]USS00167.1 ABC transporter permease [Clostridium septicum]